MSRGWLFFTFSMLWLSGFFAGLATSAFASTTATARYTENPSVIQLDIRINHQAKRAMTRRVFAEACRETNDVLACVGRPTSARVRLRKGTNRMAVTLRPQAFIHTYQPPPADWNWSLRAWHPSGFAPAESADIAFYWLGSQRAKQVQPVGAMATREVLKEGP